MPHLIMCNGERENILRRQKGFFKAYSKLWDYKATGGAFNCKNYTELKVWNLKPDLGPLSNVWFRFCYSTFDKFVYL